jgi:hypothetical protein
VRVVFRHILITVSRFDLEIPERREEEESWGRGAVERE